MANYTSIIGSFDPTLIGRIAQTIMAQKESKRDYIYPASKLSIDDRGRLAMAATKSFRVGDGMFLDWKEAESVADKNLAAMKGGEKIDPEETQVKVIEGGGALPVSQTAFNQLCGRLIVPIPVPFAKNLLAVEAGDTCHNGDLFGDLATKLLARTPENFMVRTLDNKVRAVLSDKYRTLDNADLFFAAHDGFEKVNAELLHARLWEDGFEMFAISPALRGVVTSLRRGEGGSAPMIPGAPAPVVDDVHHAAVRISNSETGNGGLRVDLAIFRRACLNRSVYGKALGAIHVGKRQAAEGLIVSDETRYLEAKVIWSKVRDAIGTAFDPKRFEAYIAKLNGATEKTIAEPAKVVESFGIEFAIAEDRRKKILESLFASRDLTRYGFAQALTWQAHELDKAGEGAAASKVEEVGGAVIEMSDADFNSIVAKPRRAMATA